MFDTDYHGESLREVKLLLRGFEQMLLDEIPDVCMGKGAFAAKRGWA
jgi:hypothetical protein